MKLLKWYNTISVFSFLFLNAIYYSEIGGSESYYRKILLVNGFLFLMINAGFIKKLFYIFIIPVILVCLSLMFNFQTIASGAINSTFYTILGMLLLSMKPLPISERLMSKLIISALLFAMFLSMVEVVNSFYTLELFMGFRNFNINPNQAGIFFYTCLTSAIYFIRSWKRWLVIIPFYLMVLATGSRAAFICSTFLVLFLELFLSKREDIEILKKNIFAIFKKFSVLGVFFVAIIYFLQDYFGYLFERLTKVGLSTESVKGEGRNMIWENVFYLINNSPTAWVFGFGPSSIDSMIGDKSTHNSFVDAIATKGLPFLVFTLLATVILMYYHYKKRHLIVVFSILNILVYGYTVSDLFGGIGTLWGLIIFLSLWTRSITKNELTLTSGNNKS
jgi:O-antigen ligase